MRLFNFKKNKKEERKKEAAVSKDYGKQKKDDCAMCHISDETLAAIKKDK